MSDEPILCYIEERTAYFTTQPLDKQWGDDWNDAPYEHNAGDPYPWRLSPNVPEYKIVKVPFVCNGETPADIAVSNSHYSVEMINAGAAAWLLLSRVPNGAQSREYKAIMAGTTLSEFKRAIIEFGGEVYTKEETGKA